MLFLFSTYYSYAQQNSFPNNGNVGIGTTTPSVKLDVNGSLKVNNSSELGGEVKMTTTSEVTNIPYNINGNGNGNGNGQSNNQDEYYRLYIDQNGVIKRGKELLVKTISFPNCGLDQADPPDSKFEDGLINKTSLLTNQTSRWNYLNNSICTCPDDFVGIGRCEPRVRLDVNGTIYGKKLILGDIDPTTIPENRLLHLKTSTSVIGIDNVILINSPVGDILKLNVNGDLTTNHLHSQTLTSNFVTVNTIFNNGAYFLNTGLSEGASQTVFTIKTNGRKIFQINNNGLVQAREIKVDIQTWPDFVFEPSYALMPLNELENFYKTQKHLPNVPDATTVEKEGINLGEMDKILLQKIEELTLYLMQQEKRIEMQQNEIDSLKKSFKR